MEQPFDENKEVATLRHIDILKRHIEIAIARARAIGEETSHLHSVLISAQRNINSLGDIANKTPFRSSLDVPTENSTRLAQKVFDIPELTEEILSHLDVVSVLHAQRVNKSMQNIIESSTRLQRQLFLAPHKSGHFREFDFSCSKGIVQTTRLYAGGHNEPAKVCINIFFENKLPKLGSRIRQMLVCQPPITRMSYWANCCQEHFHGYRGLEFAEPRYVFNENGLTLGDLHDAAQSMIADHQLCPYAACSDHHTDGIVKPDIYFYNVVDLAAGDPAEFKAKENAKEEEAKQAFKEHMKAFRNSKLIAYNRDEPIPTLAEFEAAVAASEAEQM